MRVRACWFVHSLHPTRPFFVFFGFNVYICTSVLLHCYYYVRLRHRWVQRIYIPRYCCTAIIMYDCTTGGFKVYIYLGTAALLLLCTIAPQVPGMVQHSMMFALHIVAVHLCKYIPCQVPRIIQVTNWLLLYSTGTYSTGVHGLMFNRFKRKPFCRRKPQV